MGGSWTQYDLWMKNQQMVPNLSLSVGNGDPALGDVRRRRISRALRKSS